MNRIVPWQIAMVLVTIGTYAVVLASGGSAQTAAFAAAFAAFAAAFAAFAAAFAAFAAAVAAAEQFGIPKRWTFTAYGIQTGLTFGALLTGSIVWAIMIGVVGILALLAVWKLGPSAALDAPPAGVAPAPHPNGG